MADKKLIFVKIGRSGSRVYEYAVPDATGLRDLLKMAGIEMATDEAYSVNGSPTIGNYATRDKDVITIYKQPVAKTMTVRVGRVGTRMQYITVPERVSARSCLAAAALTVAANEDVWLHENENVTPGYRINLDTIINNGYCLIIEKRVDPRIKEILRVLADCVNNESSNDEFEGIDWEDIPVSYAERIIAIK